MQKDDLIRLRHMFDSALEAVSFVANKSRKDLEGDRMLTLSLVKSIEIIGEAASRVTAGTQGKLDTIEWANIISMRNRLIHAYYDIDLDIVWSTVTEDLPPLIEHLRKIMPTESD